MTDDPQWEVLAHHELLDAAPWVRVSVETVCLHDGVTIIPDFYRVDLPDFVVIFAVTDDEQVSAVRQYRHALKQTTLEIPSGIIDAGEPPLEAAQRELLEETGLTSTDWQTIGETTVDPNRGCGRGFFFLARAAVQTSVPCAGELQTHEAVLIPLDEMRRRWIAGDFPTMSSCAGLGLGFAAYAAGKG